MKKYLEQWAEPEARLAGAINRTYERTLVVPACREEASLLDGYVVAAQTSRGRTLCILVVNGPEDATDAEHRENERCLADVLGTLKRAAQIGEDPSAWLGSLQTSSLDVLVVDRASEGARLPRKEGVGLARKIGTDIALALHAAGRVTSPYVFATDADARLPEAHFDLPAVDDVGNVAAVVLPFWHETAPDAEVTRATALYELGLRYYVEGLAWAGSPYAFHTLGSATAVTVEAYAAVRGYPRRDAAEDFYLLNKIAKVGRVVRPPAAAVRLASRTSDRTPFGTGATVSAVVGSEPGERGLRSSDGALERSFYSPDCFALLRGFLASLDGLADHASVDRFYAEVGALPDASRAVVSTLLGELGARKAFEAASAEARTPVARRIRLHTWFDAFRTLKLIHAFRSALAPNVRWTEAIDRAPFAASVNAAVSARTDSSFIALRTGLCRSEARRPMVLGPWA